MAEAVFGFLASKEIPRANDQARSPSILETKLAFKGLIQAHADLHLAQLDALHKRARNDLRLARGLNARGLDMFFPDYDADPLKRVLWRDAIENFGLMMPTIFFSEASRAAADATATSTCTGDSTDIATVAPSLKKGSFTTRVRDTAHVGSVFSSNFTITSWAIHVGRPVEARPLPPRARKDLKMYLGGNELAPLPKVKMYDRTRFAIETSSDDSGAQFGLSEELDQTISVRDAEAIIPYSLNSNDFDFETLIVREALNPVTRSPDAIYHYVSYVSAAPVKSVLCF